MPKFSIVLIILFGIILLLWVTSGPKTCRNAHLIEYTEPPVDEIVEPNDLELEAIAKANGLVENEDDPNQFADVNSEFFRVSGKSSGGRHSGGSRPSRHSGGGIRPWRPYSSYYWGLYPDYLYSYSPYPYYYNYNSSYNWGFPYNNYPNYTIESQVKRYLVRLSPKSDENPNQGKGYDKAYALAEGGYIGCGNSGATLSLQRGKTYEFDIYTSKDCVTGETEDEPFFFTTNPEGGSETGKLFNVKPTVNGTLRITIGDETPSKFYYQSTNNKLVGGIVNVHS